MQTNTVQLYTLGYTEAKTYWSALFFILGNIAMPQLFHLIPRGGMTWLPIYFFTLVGTYKYGWRVGLITAVFSPLVNAVLFDMPHAAALPAILLKSVLMAVIGGYVATRFQKATISLLMVVVLSYQIVGTLGEWAMKGDFYLAIQDFRVGVPGMLLQVFGGWAFINCLIRK